MILKSVWSKLAFTKMFIQIKYVAIFIFLELDWNYYVQMENLFFSTKQCSNFSAGRYLVI